MTRQLEEEWYERLERWGDALKPCDGRLNEGPDDTQVVIRGLQCLYELGGWEDVVQWKWNRPT